MKRNPLHSILSNCFLLKVYIQVQLWLCMLGKPLAVAAAAASAVQAITIHSTCVNTRKIFKNFKTFHITESFQATIL